jgi:hypothetical protein
MRRDNGGLSQRLSATSKAEELFATVLSETAGEVARTECFDMEQRSEVYTILEALQADAEVHRKALGCWVSDRTKEGTDV